ncbi:restriction endonuclease subunit S [Streptomyces glomeratus]|uniref:Type I restriction modification DNA specificity domain-containing protein n=1 Tax=Streptomyces glomeratus TaxID=284452 RepID=A0ABP6M4I0_9ACTN|nr:restriction endonuclease subunit S [Streptomyces glomeratus]MCF1511396.1 restriction endonuclease subunit S [Streptomyces glomeratus]
MSENEERNQLPQGWAWTSIGDVAEVSGGIQKQQKRRPVKNKFPFLRVANVGRGSLNLAEVHEIELFDGEIDRYRLEPGDLLVVEGNGSPDQIGRAARWRDAIKDAVHQNHLIRVRPGPAISASYLEAVWNAPAVSAQLWEVAQSTSGLYTLSTAKVKRVRIPLPPLAEQHRIVEALEDHVSRLDNADSTLDTCGLRLRRLRDSAVQRIMDGLAPCHEEHLEQLLREPLRNGHSAPATEAQDGIRTLTLTAVTTKNFTDANTKITSADPARVSKLWLEPGDIFVQRSNTPELVGSSALYVGEPNWAIFPDLLIRVRTNERVSPEFAALGLASPKIRAYYRSSAKGLAGSMPKIDQGVILRTKLPVPTPDVQLQAVEEAASYERQIARSLEQLTKISIRSRHLRAALLRRAFEGRLVPQDPNDEPSSALLARVAAERADTAKPARRRASRRPRTAPAQQEFDV